MHNGLNRQRLHKCRLVSGGPDGLLHRYRLDWWSLTILLPRFGRSQQSSYVGGYAVGRHWLRHHGHVSKKRSCFSAQRRHRAAPRNNLGLNLVVGRLEKCQPVLLPALRAILGRCRDQVVSRQAADDTQNTGGRRHPDDCPPHTMPPSSDGRSLIPPTQQSLPGRIAASGPNAIVRSHRKRRLGQVGGWNCPTHPPLPAASRCCSNAASRQRRRRDGRGFYPHAVFVTSMIAWANA